MTTKAQNRSSAVRRQRPAILATSIVALFSLYFEPSAARAVDWTGATNNSWDTSSNWSTSATPVSTDDLFFPAAFPSSGSTIFLSNGEVANSLNFLDTYTLTGGALTLTTGNVDVMGGATATIESRLDGSAGLTMATAGVLVLAGANTYTGTTAITFGTVQLGANNALPTTTALTINAADGNTQGLLDLHGFNQTVSSLTIVAPQVDGGSTAVTGAGTLTLNGNVNVIDNTSAPGDGNGSTISVSTLDLGGAVRTFAVGGQEIAPTPELSITSVIQNGGVIINANPSSSDGSQSVVEFSGANTYTGATTVNKGALQVDGSLGNTVVTVNKQATLSGSGTIAGPVNILAGGNLSPGSADTPGGLTLASLVLNAGANTNLRLEQPGAVGDDSINDVVQVTNNLTIGGNLNVTQDAGFGIGSYTLFTYGGTLTNKAFSSVNGNDGFTATLVTGIAHEVDLLVTSAAGVQFWDGPGVVGDSHIAGGNGNWNNTTHNWTNASGATNAAWLGATAVFAAASGTVNLTAPISVQGIIFNSSGYVLNGSTSALTLVDPTISVTNSGAIATINAQITGTAGLTANGAGTLILTNPSNNYTGGTAIPHGTIQLGANNALPTDTELTINSAGGDSTGLLDLHGFNQTIAGLTVVAPLYSAGIVAIAGAGTLTLTGDVNVIDNTNSPGDSFGPTISAGVLDLGGTVRTFTVAGQANAPTPDLIITSVIQNGGVIINANNSSNDGSPTIVQFTGVNTYTGPTTVNTGTLQIDGALGNTAVTVNVGATLSGNGGNIAGTVTILAGGTLAPGDGTTPGTLTVGSLILTGGANSTFRLGQPDAVSGGVNDLVNVTGSLTIGGNLNVTPLTGFGIGSYTLITYGGTLSNNGFSAINGPTGLTATVVTGVAHEVDLVMSATAGVQFWDGAGAGNDGVISGGTGTWNNASNNWTNADGTANTTWQEATAVFTAPGGTVTLAAPVSTQGLIFAHTGYVINGGGFALTLAAPTISVTNAGDVATINAQISGTNGLVSVGTGALILTNPLNNYTGGTSILHGALQLGANNALPTTTALTVNSPEGSLAGLLDLHGFNQTISGLTIVATQVTTGSTSVTGAGTLTLNGDVSFIDNTSTPGNSYGSTISVDTLDLGGAVRTFTVAGQNITQKVGSPTPELAISSVIQNGGVTINANPSSTTGASATVEFSGANTYTGATTINSGTLQVDGSLANTTVTVNNHGTLSGFGSIGGTVNVLAGGHLFPGDPFSPGTLTVANLILNAGATSIFRLEEPGALGPGTDNLNDGVAVTTNLTIGGTLNVPERPGFGIGSYTLFTYGGSLTNNSFGAINLMLSNQSTIDMRFSTTLITSVPGEVDLIVASSAGAQFWDGTGTANDGVIAGGSGTWNATATNWTNASGTTNSTWHAGTAVFTGTGGTVTLASPLTVQGIIFNSTGYVISGTSTLTLQAQDISVTHAGDVATINAKISGTGGLAVNGPGTLILGNSMNSYTGGTFIYQGTLQLGANNALPMSTVLTINTPPGDSTGLFDLHGFNQSIAGLVIVAPLYSPGSTAITGAGTLTLTGGLSLIDNSISPAGTGLVATIDAANLDLGGAVRTLTIAGQDNIPTPDLIIDSVIKNGGINLIGNPSNFNDTAALVQFSGNNTYTGATTITEGILQAGSTQAFGIGSAVTMTANGALDLNGNDNSIGSLSGVDGSFVDNSSADAATLTVGNSATTTYAGIIENSGGGTLGLTKVGTGTLILSGANTYTGQTTVNGGTLQIGDGATTGTSIASSGTVQVNATGTLAIDLINGMTFTNAVVLNATTASLSTIQGGTDILAGVISGTGGFNQNGPGLTILTSIDTYTGATKVNAGILQIGDGVTGGFAGTSGITVAGNATPATDLPDGSTLAANVNLSAATAAFNALQAGTNTISSVISGTGIFNQSGSGTTILGNTNLYTGKTTISNGNLQIGIVGTAGFIAAGSAIGISNGGKLTLVNIHGNILANSITNGVGGTGTVNVNSTNTTTLSGALSDGTAGQLGLTQGGSGTTILTNADTYSGTTTVSGGILQIGAGTTASSIGAHSAIGLGTGGTLSLVNVKGNILTNDITNSLGGTGLVNINSTANLALSGAVADGAGTLALTKGGVGITTLSGNNNYSGATTINGGTLQVGNGIAAGATIASSGAVQVNATGTLAVDLTTGSTFANAVALNAANNSLNTIQSGINTLSGVLSGSGGFNQNGPGTSILTATDSYSGATKVNAGTLQIGNGTAGTLTATSGITVSGTGTLAIDLAAGLTLAANVNLSAAGTALKAVEPGIITASGIISGTGLFIQNGSGTIILSNTETYTGVTNVTAGTLQVDGSLATGSTVNIATAGTLSGAGTIRGKATLTGNGAINFGTNGNIAGTLGITGGTWSGQGKVLGLVTSSSGAFNLTGNLTAPLGLAVTGGTLTGAGTLNGNLNYTSGTSSTFGGVITGASSTLTMNKAAFTLTLTGSNTYNGVTTVSAGTLQIGNGAAGTLAGTSGVTVGGTGTLAMDLLSNTTFAANVNLSAAGATFKAIETGTNTVSSTISGTGVFNQAGGGTTILPNPETYTGATNVTSGFLEVDGSLAAGSTVNIATAGTLKGTGTIHGKATLTGNGIINLSSGAILGSTLAITGGNWNGLGTVDGLITSSGSTFNLNDSLTALAGVAVTGGTLAGTGTLTGSLTDTSSSSMTFAGVIAGAASTVTMNKATTTLTLTGMNTYSGATTVTAGTLQVGDSATTGASLGASSVTTAAAGTLTTNLANGETFSNNVTDTGHVLATGTTNNYTVSSAIIGAGNFTKTGGNTVTVTGTNTYKGGTAVSGGTLLVNNTAGSGTGSGTVAINNGGTLGGSGTIVGAVTLNNGGTLSPGAGSVGTPGTTLHASSLMWNGGGSLTLQLGSSANDALVLTGALTKGTAGTYTVNIEDDGGIPLTSYTLATFASTTFTATTFQLEMPGNYVGHLVQTATQLILDVSAGSGQQPAHSDSVASSDVAASGDPTGIPTPTEFRSETLSITPTPEPDSAVLLAFGGAGLFGWRRRRSK